MNKQLIVELIEARTSGLLSYLSFSTEMVDIHIYPDYNKKSLECPDYQKMLSNIKQALIGISSGQQSEQKCTKLKHFLENQFKMTCESKQIPVSKEGVTYGEWRLLVTEI